MKNKNILLQLLRVFVFTVAIIQCCPMKTCKIFGFMALLLCHVDNRNVAREKDL